MFNSLQIVALLGLASISTSTPLPRSLPKSSSLVESAQNVIWNVQIPLNYIDGSGCPILEGKIAAATPGGVAPGSFSCVPSPSSGVAGTQLSWTSLGNSTDPQTGLVQAALGSATHLDWSSLCTFVGG